MDQLFATETVDIDIGMDGHARKVLPPGVRRTLLVDPSREDRLYLRARLALAGLIEVDEAETVAQAAVRAREQHFDVVIVNVDMLEEPWGLVERLAAQEPAVGSVVVTTANSAWVVHERAERAGCRAVINRPYEPGHVFRVLQMV
jgi:AmiR/NasT family two-component response regulator